MTNTSAIVWFRRDLRLNDHAALSQATRNHTCVYPIFVFDPHILDRLPSKCDRRVHFIAQGLEEIDKSLAAHGKELRILFGAPEHIIPKLVQELDVGAVYSNRDYEPYAKDRDHQVEQALRQDGVGFHQFKDSVIFEKHEVLTGSNDYYKVFTPYKNKWLNVLGSAPEKFRPILKNLASRSSDTPAEGTSAQDILEEIGFESAPPLIKGGQQQAAGLLASFRSRIETYHDQRNFPAVQGTSLLSVHLRHGTISIRQVVAAAMSISGEGASTWLSELVWRDFYQMILDAFPHVSERSFKQEYDRIKWPGKDEWFLAWCEGKTGIPIIDAPMRELNETGLMHNRLRMVVANFLCKTMQIDWRRGEEYFADKLLDFDMAANNGGWQWSASTGTDAQPYFRIFNPFTQAKKFDPNGEYVKRWIPELAPLHGKDLYRPNGKARPYPREIVSYEAQRPLTLELYKQSLSKET